MAEPEETTKQDGAESFMSIGGIDVREMQAAHAQHPVLSRWHETTLRLIPDLQQQLDQARQIIPQQGKRIEELEAEVERLKKKYEPESGDKSADAR